MEDLDKKIREARVGCGLPPESLVIFVPLINDEREIWCEFKKLDEGNPILHDLTKFSEAKKFVEPYHPIVSLIGDFAVNAFNELCKNFVKKHVLKNLHEVEIMELQYISMLDAYLFFITLEAVEEDTVGVYEARVICYRNTGMKSLIKFVRSDRRPMGKKAESSANFIRLKSRYLDVKGEMTRTKAVGKAMKVRIRKQKSKKKSKDALELISLKKEYNAKKGVCRMLYRQIKQLKHPYWETDWDIGRTNKSDWSRPKKDTGMLTRHTPHCFDCCGYDYCSKLPAFGMYMYLLSCYGGEFSNWYQPF